MLEPMSYKLKPWQWTLVGVAFSIYCVLATFGIYGGFYLGFPPYTPAFLNHTRQNITQTITLERKTLLRLTGNVREYSEASRLDRGAHCRRPLPGRPR